MKGLTAYVNGLFQSFEYSLTKHSSCFKKKIVWSCHIETNQVEKPGRNSTLFYIPLIISNKNEFIINFQLRPKLTARLENLKGLILNPFSFIPT